MKKEQLTVNNEQRAILSFLIAVFSFLIFIGCENPTTSKDNVPTIPAGKGSFSLTLSDTGRTILPVTPNLNDFAKYNLNFTPVNNGSAENVDRTNTTLPTDPILLEPGTYNLVVNAYKDNNKAQLVAQGTLDGIVITAGKNTSANVTLETLVSGGTGTFRWNISLPSGVTANMIITPGNTDGTQQQTVNLSPPTTTGSRTLNSGPYSLTFNLSKTDGKKVVWNELLYVYQNLESVFTFTFTDAHLSDSNYTVTYNRNNGTSNSTQSVLHGNALTAPANPTRSGCVFSGWYTDDDTFANSWDFNNPVIESFTLYAKWNCTITFNANGGSGTVPSAQTVQAGSSITLPSGSGLTRNYAVFDGWNTNADGMGDNHSADSSFTPTGNITLYAKWDWSGTPLESVMGLAEKLAWLQARAQSGGSYILEVNADESIVPHTLSYNNRSNIGVTLIGVGTNRTISLSSNGAMFTVVSGVTLILDNNIILQGHSDNTNSLVRVNSGGTLIMNTGSTITSNNTISSVASFPSLFNGGGVTVMNGGTFTMDGGKITGNTIRFPPGNEASWDGNATSWGGGVFVNGTFTMNGGEISDNTVCLGGGVYVGGTFTMNGGEISDNTVTSSTNGHFIVIPYGGGVYVDSVGTFTMEGGTISGNTHSYSPSGISSIIEGGGGVYVRGTFTMNNGEISDNTTGQYGGGVYVYRETSGTFTMAGGTISGNTASFGGGVYGYGSLTMTGGTISGNTASSGGGMRGSLTMTGGTISSNTASSGGGVSGSLTMTGGTISGNIASSDGGGVYVGGTFTKTGGTITGYGSDTENGNVVKNGSVVQNNQGHAVYAGGNLGKRRETTAGLGVNLFFGLAYYPPWSGVWDDETTYSSLIPLTGNTWTNRNITLSGSGSVVWCSFNVTNGTTYYVWWNDCYQGDSTKTADIRVSAYYSDGSNIFENVDSGWSSPRSFTANTSGTVRIVVSSYFAEGTFAIAYSTSSTRP